ncbi:MAG: hypothetical protein KG029_12260 [Bacteroidetes bacterium]|nr:hypothetical protein [Bacteroidota bacterium]
MISKTAILMGWGASNIPTDTKDFPARSFFLSNLKKTIGHITVDNYEKALLKVINGQHNFDEKLYGQQINLKWFNDMVKPFERKKTHRKFAGLVNPLDEVFDYLERYCNRSDIYFSKIDFEEKFKKLNSEKYYPDTNIKLLTTSYDNTKALTQ